MYFYFAVNISASVSSIIGTYVPNYTIILELRALAYLGKFDREEYELLRKLYVRQWEDEIKVAKLDKKIFELKHGDKR